MWVRLTGVHRLPRSWPVVVATLLAIFCATSSAWAQTVAFTVAAPATTTAAGLVGDPVSQLYWLAQPPSGPTPGGDLATTVLGVNGDGSVVARLTVATSVDVTAIAWYDKSLYLADIADPGLTRQTVTVYGVPAAAVGGDKEVPYATYPLAYPDGPHDAAAILIRPDGRLFLITVDGRLYQAPANLSQADATTLAFVGPVPTGVTAGLFLTQDLLAVRTATAIVLLDANTRAATQRSSGEVPGRGLALDLSGTEFLTASSAGSGVTVAAVPIPGPAQPSPSAPASAGEPGAGSRRGTQVMILAAAVLAVVGGVLAFLRH